MAKTEETTARTEPSIQRVQPQTQHPTSLQTLFSLYAYHKVRNDPLLPCWRISKVKDHRERACAVNTASVIALLKLLKKSKPIGACLPSASSASRQTTSQEHIGQVTRWEQSPAVPFWWGSLRSCLQKRSTLLWFSVKKPMGIYKWAKAT